MRLVRNIFLLGLVLVTLASCSKDEDEALSAPASAKLTIGIKASGTATKADDTNELLGEANINNLAVVVFSEDGTQLLGSLWQATPGKERTAIIADVPAKATRARIIVLANIPQEVVTSTTSYEDLYSRMADLSVQEQTNLTMSSPVITTTNPLNEGDNYLGYEGVTNVNGLSAPLLLTRLTARVDVVNISATFAGTPLAGRSVRIDDIAVYAQKNKSRYFSSSDWGAVELPGNLSNSDATPLQDAIVRQGEPLSGRSYAHYVMENMTESTHTRIAIKATLLATDALKEQTKLFTAEINTNGLVSGYDHSYIKRNYVYRLRLGFDGTSFEDPENSTALSVAVEVVGWGPVNQAPVIE